MVTHYVLVLCLGTALVSSAQFYVDWENDRFVKDGLPFQYVAAGMHYFRVPYQYWPNRVSAAKSAGCNAVQTYVAWNAHEPRPGHYDFTGNNNLVGFIKEVQRQDMVLILRVGPYICGEWNFGGLPPWLLGIPGMEVRSMNPDYMSAVDSWLHTLLPLIRPYLYKNGGPIIMVQVENEYGSFGCEHEYMDRTYDIFHEILQDDTVYFTTDGPGGVKCGSFNNTQVLTTIDFGVGGDPAAKFANLKKFQPHGPSVNSEFYTGWLDHWKSKHSKRAAQPLGEALDKLLSIGASVNFYMWHGGTNFGLTSGAQKSFLKANPTSYDYDAPQSEWGDIKPEKYWAIRNVTDKYFPGNKLPVPHNSTKLADKVVPVHFAGTLASATHFIQESAYPRTMEELGVFEGMVAYHHKLAAPLRNATVVVRGVHDRAYVVADVFGDFLQIISRDNETQFTVRAEDSITVYVENMGYIGFGKCMKDMSVAYKGMLNVTVDGEVLTGWNHYAINLTSPFYLAANYLPVQKPVQKPVHRPGTRPLLPHGPSVYGGGFTLQREEVLDTFLDTRGWGKGYLVINGVLIGRYWPEAGPQDTLYVPSVYLREGENIVLMIELQYPPVSPSLTFTDLPVINGPVDPNA